MRKTSFAEIFFLVICTSLILIYCVSCSPSYKVNRAVKLTNKAIRISKATVAQITRDTFPCITTGSDTVSVVSDSVVYIECPGTGENNRAQDYTNTPNSGELNTANSPQLKWSNLTTYRVPVHLPVVTKYITQKIEDSAKIYLVEKQSADQIKQISKLEKKSERRGKWNLYLIIGLLVSVLLNVIQFKRR